MTESLVSFDPETPVSSLLGTKINFCLLHFKLLSYIKAYSSFENRDFPRFCNSLPACSYYSFS